MPLHRSARLFSLGLALAGTCAAQNTQQNKQRQTPKALAVRAEGKNVFAKLPKKRADKVKPGTVGCS